ncbi:MAG TPA: AAA family ATPase [Longimicrobium sp.]|jgi:chromosome partitioning protein|nr:AAA family ATPase [Longimicrobium sp.]
MSKRLSVINFKGGVGKTALALHLGCFLAARRGKLAKVLFVDVDHQSSLSIVVLDPQPWEEAIAAETTINRVFSAFTTQGAALPGLDAIVKTPFGTKFYPTIDIAPAQLELDDTEIELGSTTIGNPLVSEWRKRTLLSRWLSESGADDEYDFIVFDCPPATKIVSQNAIAASHAYVVPVIPDPVSTRGVTHLINLIESRIDARMKLFAATVPAAEIPPAFVPDTKLAGIVITMAQTHGPAFSGYINEHSTQMAALRRQWGGAVLENIIERAAGVAESLGAGWPVYNRWNNANVANRNLPKMYDSVCSELVTRLGW